MAIRKHKLNENTEPNIDFSSFKFKAVVDWLEFKITTSRPTNFFSIRRIGNLSFVRALDKGPGGAATEFVFRIQDIDDWTSVEALLTHLEEKFGFAIPAKITAAEIAMDIYGGGNSDYGLLLAHLYKYLQNPASDNRRMAFSYKGSTKGTSHLTLCKSKQLFSEGWTAYIGDQRSDSVCHRIYYKKTDNNAQDIPKKDWRARVEISLSNEACPFNSLEAARKYQFSSLARWFKFRQPNPSLDSVAELVLRRTPAVGRTHALARQNGGVRRHSRNTVSNIYLGNKTYDALRNLSKRLAEHKKSGKSNPYKAKAA